jgi:uncharacterized membrane protein
MLAIELARWVHFVGIATWLAGLVSMGLLLRAGAPARPGAIIADAGATITIISGIYQAASTGLFVQPYIHIKLLFVAALLGVHTAMRIRVRRKDGRSAASMVVVAGILATIIIYVIEFRPLAR